jgi:AraC-like DNA-binding protein
VTVQGETPTVSVGDATDAEQLFTELYKGYARRVHSFIWWHLGIEYRALAEDLTQETFIAVWRSLTTGKGFDPEKPYGLLRYLARQQIGAYFSKKKNNDFTLDFTDPVNTPLVTTGHAYALERPDTTDLVRDLDEVMEQMQAASKAWRDAHKESHRLRSLLGEDYNTSRGGITEATKERLREQLAEADQHEDETLHAFRDTCRRVGALRAELEELAGPNWRSGIGLPLHPEITPIRKGRYRNDPDVTHCPAGHLLDLNNTHFEEDGSRYCRACRNDRYVAAREEAHEANPRMFVRTTDPEKIVQARDMLTGADAVHLSIAAVAQKVGLSSVTLLKYIPDAAELRRTAGAGARYAQALEAARRLLTDPECLLSLHEVAAQCGVSYTAMKRNFPAEVDVCLQRHADARVDPSALDRARRMLTDPDSCLTVHEIARSCGIQDTTLRGRLPKEIDACRRKLEQRKNHLREQARTMLADPECRYGIKDIARATGMTDKWVSRNFADEIAGLNKRLAAQQRRTAERVRQIFADPTRSLSLAAIAQACGTNDKWIKRNLSEELAAYRGRQKQTAGAA